jgi:hypothetical protein
MDITTDYPARVAAVVEEAMTASKITTNRLATLTGIPRETVRRKLLGKPPGFTATEIALIAPQIDMKVSDIYLAAEGSAA